jgi:hypothetical protein
MTLASGCGNKTLVRLGGGNLKSLVVLAVAAAGSYLMLWTGFYAAAFESWIAPTTIDLAKSGMPGQSLGDLAGSWGPRANAVLGTLAGIAIAAFTLSSRDFRASFDNVLGGIVVGLAVVAGWAITASALGEAWKARVVPHGSRRREPRRGRRDDGSRRRPRHGLHHRPGHHRGVDPRPGLVPGAGLDRRRAAAGVSSITRA